MPGLYGLSNIARGIERNYKLRNPKPGHFKVKKHTGLGARMLGTYDERWFIHHKDVIAIEAGPFDTKEDAKRGIGFLVDLLRIVNNKKLTEDERQLLLKQTEQKSLDGEYGKRYQALQKAQQFLEEHRSSKKPQTESENKICPFCAETIKEKAIICRYCGKDLEE